MKKLVNLYFTEASNQVTSPKKSDLGGTNLAGTDSNPSADRDDSFDLYDLKIEVVAGDKPMVCDHQLGDTFYLQGEMLIFPPEGRQRFPLYPLAALLPLLPAKQRPTHPHDWMTTDAEIACPDPHCGALFRITRLDKRRFSHAETTRVPLPGKESQV
jgi:uncharacterized repeat protein (TIGR04076 family)